MNSNFINGKFFSILILLFSFLYGCSDKLTITDSDVHNDSGSDNSIENVYPIPNPLQLKYQEDEMIACFHFGISTYTMLDPGNGKEDINLFNPTKLDCNQWLKPMKDAGFKSAMLTVKHHDGFCLWPSKYSLHTVANVSFMSGKSDILGQFSQACKANGLNLGIYLSPLDFYEPTYGSSAYNDYYANQLVEVMKNYGKISEIWLDGFTGRGPNLTQQDFDWQRYYLIVKQLQPEALISIMGPDIRWVGNEDGLGNEISWSTYFGHHTLYGYNYGLIWAPTECDVSDRLGWFYNPANNYTVKNGVALFNLYLSSVGMNSNLLLNFAPSTEGLIEEPELRSLREFRQLMDQVFIQNRVYPQYVSGIYRADSTKYSPNNVIDDDKNSFWVTPLSDTTGALTFSFQGVQHINLIRLEEMIKYGQRIAGFTVFYRSTNGDWVFAGKGVTVGHTRIIEIPPVDTDAIRINITKSIGSPTLRFVGFYYKPF